MEDRVQQVLLESYGYLITQQEPNPVCWSCSGVELEIPKWKDEEMKPMKKLEREVGNG